MHKSVHNVKVIMSYNKRTFTELKDIIILFFFKYKIFLFEIYFDPGVCVLYVGCCSFLISPEKREKSIRL